jgi:hypothetical protein
VDCCVNELSAFAAWIRRENRSRPTIVRALELRASYLLGVASQTVDISGASTAMQACGMPRRGQDLPNATRYLSFGLQCVFLSLNVQIGGGTFSNGTIGFEFRQSLQNLTFVQASAIQSRFLKLAQDITESHRKEGK